MDAKEYLKAHSLDENFVKERGWTLDSDKITIPIYGTDGKFIYNKYRHLIGESKFTADAGSHPALYCAEHVKEVNEVILCEGEPDCIRLWQEGVPAVTGTFGVGTFNTKIAEALKGKKIFVLLDTDEAGIGAIDKYCSVLFALGIDTKIIELPNEYKDISEYLTDNHNKKDIELLKKQAIGFDQWQEKHLPEEWSLETGKELIERDLPQEEWLIDRVIPSEGFTFIVGAESTGKSFYTLTIANAVATGTPWLDKFPIGKQTNVLFIDKENSPRRKQSRIGGLKFTKGLEKMYWIKYPHHFQLADNKEEDGVSRFAKMLSKKVEKLDIGLIIIDSFADVMVGNENTAGDVQLFFDAIRSLFPNKSILVLHHENKPSQGVTRNSSQRVRGSTNITAQIVSGFRVFSLPKTTNEFVLEQFKAGDAEKLKPFKVELVTETNPYTQKTYVSGIKHNGDYYDEEGKIETATTMIEDYLIENITATRQELITFTNENGISVRTFNRAISSLVDDERIEKIRKGKFTNYVCK